MVLRCTFCFEICVAAWAVLANLIAFGVAYYMISGGFLLVGIPLAILALVTVVSAALGYKD